MKFTLNSLFGLTTISAVVIGLIAVTVRVAFESDAGTLEVLGLVIFGGAAGGLFGLLVGLFFVRQPLSALAAALTGFAVGATFAVGTRSGTLFATSVVGYCLIASVLLVAAAVVARWSSAGKADSFSQRLSRYALETPDSVPVKVVENEANSEATVPPIRRHEHHASE